MCAAGHGHRSAGSEDGPPGCLRDGLEGRIRYAEETMAGGVEESRRKVNRQVGRLIEIHKGSRAGARGHPAVDRPGDRPDPGCCGGFTRKCEGNVA